MYNSTKIYGFYFICLINDWTQIVYEQLDKLYKSELYKKTDKFYVRVFFTQDLEYEKLQSKLLMDSKIVLSKTNINEYEFGTLNLIQKTSKNENFYCYYFHSKGVSKLNHRGLVEPIKSWRKYMEYFMIDKHEVCIKELDLGYDAVGVKLRQTPSNLGKDNPNKFWWTTAGLSKKPDHFSGNFWWSKSSLIKSLPNIELLSKGDRHEAEFWIGYTNGKLKCLHNSNQAGYKSVITENYIN